MPGVLCEAFNNCVFYVFIDLSSDYVLSILVIVVVKGAGLIHTDNNTVFRLPFHLAYYITLSLAITSITRFGV